MENTTHFEIIDDVLVIHINGELDHHASLYIRQADRIIYEKEIINIVFDFKNTEFMDSSGIGVIMGRYKKIKAFGGKIGAINVGSNVEKILTFSGLNKIVNHYRNLEHALDELSSGVTHNVQGGM